MLALLARGADPNKLTAGTTPLIEACWYNQPLTAEHLLKWGAVVDKRNDVDNITALHEACVYNSMDCVQVLMDHNSRTGEPVCVCSCVHSLAAMLGDCQLV